MGASKLLRSQKSAFAAEAAEAPSWRRLFSSSAAAYFEEMMMRTTFAILSLFAAPAFAGDCRYGNYAGQSVVTCDDGYTETRGAHGSRSYGIRNGGFERYPGQAPPPWAMERREAR